MFNNDGTIMLQLLNSASSGARSNAKKVMLLLTDNKISDSYVDSFSTAIAAVTGSNIQRIGSYTH